MEDSVAKTLIADRYELVKLTAHQYHAPQTASWVADDQVLSRKLRAIVIDADHPFCAGAVDGARRASLFRDSQSVAIISVEETPSSTVIFTEFPLGKNLSTALRAAPKSPDQKSLLPSDFVHAMIGQVARIIANARHFGLRCLHLNAANIYLTDANQVILDGLGVLAPLHGAVLDLSSEQLDRAEARGLVVFLAALLLGEDFPQDPSEHDARVHEAFAMATGSNLPQQIIDVFRNEINGNGPQSAGDFMRLLAPWNNAAISQFLSTLNIASAFADDLSANIENPLASDEFLEEVAAENANLAITPNWPKVSAASSLSATENIADLPLAEVVNDDADSVNSLAADLVSADTAHSSVETSQIVASADASPSDSVQEILSVPAVDDPLAGNEDSADPENASSPNTVADSLHNPAGDESSSNTIEIASETVAEIEVTAKTAITGETFSDTTNPSIVSRELDDSFQEVAAKTHSMQAKEALPQQPPAQNSRLNSATLVLLFFLGVITFALLFGFWRVLQPLDAEDADPGTVQSTTEDNPKNNDEKAEKQAAAAAPAVAVPAVIESLELVSSDTSLLAENNSAVTSLKQGLQNLADDNPETAWSTWWFRTPAVYEQGKLGVVITLKEETTLNEVLINTRSNGGLIQWRKLDAAHPVDANILAKAEKIAEAEFSATLSLKATQPMKTKKFLLWIDQIPSTGNENRAEIVNITLK
ncbi:hypothetical protein [Arcanobacterium hippocoleae]|uniref:hypothetical protein n=1 Tax=Arcanobacterium hippocoleae TaxID=149017 RepID=UPI0033414BB3